MPTVIFSFTVSLCIVQFATARQRKQVTVDDGMKLASLVDVRISPQGNQVAYVVSRPSLAKNQHEPALFVVSVFGGAPKRLAETARILNIPLPSPKLRWTPDGARISFIGMDKDKPQVFAVSAAGGEAQALTEAAEGVFSHEWSPDGKNLAYLTRDSMSLDEQQRRKDQSFVIHVDAPERPTRLVLKPLNGSERFLTPPEHFVENLSWSPDGGEIAYAAAPTTGFMAQYATRIYVVTIDGGNIRLVANRKGMNSTPRYSPDGLKIAFISTNGTVSLMSPRGLAVAPAGGGGSVRSYGLDDAWVSDVTWAPDGKSIFLLTTDGTFGRNEHMFEQSVVRVWTASGKSERVAGETTANYLLSISRDGTKLAYKRVEPRTMGDVVVHDMATGRVSKITDVNPELRDFALGSQKVIKWRSFDGMEIWGLLLTPPNYASGRKVPLLVYCHGGPNGGVTYGLFPQFMHVVSQVDYYPVEAMASAGFAILFPMPRGGAGYGEKGQRAIVNDWGGADYKDIMAGVDHVIAAGVADPERLGVMGASYGGYMTNWIVTQTGRFKAASSGASLSDLTDQYFLSDGGEVMAEYFKRPWEARESYAAHSPLTFADRVTTPLLLQHGERDVRVPIANTWKFYRALKQLGKTVEFDIHPRNSHVFYEPMQEREAMRRNLEWFTKWIKVP
ncbi:MAG: S9 family peptidase [Ignavibacteriales bacterium]|nr:S9 family peptidase [Ignavibacteriales bacterium]